MMLGSPGPGMMDIFSGDDGTQLEIITRKLSDMEPDDDEFEDAVKKRRKLQLKIKIKELESQLDMAKKSDGSEDSFVSITGVSRDAA
jgi:hypothetical protein